MGTYKSDEKHPEKPWFPGALAFDVHDQALKIIRFGKIEGSETWVAEYEILVGRYPHAFDVGYLLDMMSETHEEFDARVARPGWRDDIWLTPRKADATDISAIPGVWTPESERRYHRRALEYGVASTMEYETLLAERYLQEARLKALGFDVDGAGVGFGGWDIFVYLHPDDPEEIPVMLGSVKDVDAFISENT